MSREPRRLKDVLDQGQFAVTIEYNPPKGTNIMACWRMPSSSWGACTGST